MSNIKLNDGTLPRDYDADVFKLAEDRIQLLRKEHLERVVDGMKV